MLRALRNVFAMQSVTPEAVSNIMSKVCHLHRCIQSFHPHTGRVQLSTSCKFLKKCVLPDSMENGLLDLNMS